jgi:hypothetical protein
MNCRYCGTDLPDEALFCPECGRAVTDAEVRVSAKAPAPAAGFSIAELAFSSPEVSSVDPVAVAAPPVQTSEPAEARCPQCGAATSEDDVFCGECGFVLRHVSTHDADNAHLPTSIIVLPSLITLAEPAVESSAATPAQADAAAPAEPDPTSEVAPVPFGALNALPPHDPPADAPEEVPIDELVHETPAQVAAHEAAVVPVDPDLEFDEPLPFSLPVAMKPSPSTRSRPIPDPFPWGTESPLREDIEATRIIAETASGIRFVLQFSTGESVTVLGSGLVGRNPSMQPGEYVDQLVPIFDAGKSVSKTHLEYGQEAGRFWISDRYSTNGSTIRQPDTEPRRADPGRRYFIARGTRVDLGEQFFVVS